MSTHKSWRLLPAALGAAALTFTVLPTAASAADNTVINDTPEDQVPSVRWSGETRYDTAAKLAVEGTEATVSTPATSAILATGENFPDALAGAYLSGQVGGPILLTERDTLPQETLDILSGTDEDDLTQVETIYLLGGPVAISEGVESQLETLGFDVVRLDGEDRVETAALIATEAPDGTVGEVDGQATAIVARSDNFPDALVTGAAARNAELPLLLTETDELPQDTIDALAELDIDQILLPGGLDAISQDVEDELEELGYTVERFDGATRLDTAVEFARYSIDTLGFTDDEVAVARGDFFPDALTVAPFAGREAFPVVLAEAPSSLGTSTQTFLESIAECTTDTLFIPGGLVAVDAGVEAAARAALTTSDDCADVDNEAPTMVGAFRVGDDGIDADTVAREAPGPTDDVAIALFDEPVTGTDADPAAAQFRYVDPDGETTDATSVDYDDSDQVVLGFPTDTIEEDDDGEAVGSIEYLRAGAREFRVTDLEGNEAVNETEVRFATTTEVNTTTDAVDANIGDGDCATADGDCSLRAAIQEANSDPDFDIITLGTDATYPLTIDGADEEATATGDLDITSGLRLVGNGSTIDADAITDRAFDVASGFVQLSDLTVTNGEVTGDADRGGAIRVTGANTTFQLSDATISDSTAPQAGGGIENTGADVTIVDTDFSGNSTGDTPGNGGAFHAAGGTSDIAGGEVTENTAEEGGGFWIGGGELVVSGTTFTGNVAEGGNTDAGERQGGGAIFNVNGTLAVTDATFTDNTAVGDDDDAGSGGAIMATTADDGAATTTVETSTFTNNTADRAGGAIENDGSAVLQVSDTTFDGNTATGDDSAGNGGAIHTIGDAVVDGDTDANAATGNTADEGGAFWVGGGATLTVDGTDFSANTAEGDADTANGGGALYNIGATLNVTNATFDANLATGDLGSGGAILGITTDAAAPATVTVQSSEFTGNLAVRAGGAIENAGATLAVDDSTFTGNGFSDTDADTPSNGGAIHDGGGDTTVADSTFTSNTAIEGGALWVSGTMSVTDTTLTDNIASDAGSALYNSGGTLTLDSVTANFDAALPAPLPAPGAGITLLEDEGDGSTTITTAGGNTLDDGDTDNPTCNVVIGTESEGDGNDDDDNTCFTAAVA